MPYFRFFAMISQRKYICFLAIANRTFGSNHKWKSAAISG